MPFARFDNSSNMNSEFTSILDHNPHHRSLSYSQTIGSSSGLPPTSGRLDLGSSQSLGYGGSRDPLLGLGLGQTKSLFGHQSHLSTTSTTTLALTAPTTTTTTTTFTSRNLKSLSSGFGAGTGLLGGAPSGHLTDDRQPTGVRLTGAGASSVAGRDNMLQQMLDDMRHIEDTVDSIEIPARGRCRVYMAKYGYDPFKQSPNENPDAELAFNAGDYIMVFEDLDEDGYFIGELMDGRRGYVPSNWLDRLTGEDLFEFQATTLYKQNNNLRDEDGSESQSYPPEFYDAIVSDTMNHSNFQHLLAPEDYHRMNDYVDLDDVNEVDDECLSDYERAEAEQMRRAVPPPQRLVIERQLNKSILIGWLHPQAAKGTIVSYQVYVDGVLKSTVPSGDRTKALLEGVDSNIPHRISVRAIDLEGRHSNDAGCTIVIGQRVPFAPSCVKASHITSDSALISWLPCNSNFHHVVAVNSVEVQTVRPGVYKHLINGLSANTLYRVWVRAKPGKILSIDEKNPRKLESLTTYVDFKTMPKSLPDPPVNVQVEAGPQRRTLLVTWLPLTLNDFRSSNGCAVTGYAVFAGHKKLADIDSPSGDHALLNLADLESLHKKSVTVRTKSGENLSQDSMPCQIPDEYLKAAAGNSHPSQSHTTGHSIGGPSVHHNNRSTSLHHQRYSDASQTASHLPSRHSAGAARYAGHQHQAGGQLHQAGQSMATGYRAAAGGGLRHGPRGRQMTRSLQNLDSDLDSRRSSIPAIEVTRDHGDLGMMVNHRGANSSHNNESYSEEEFESSMRFRGVRGKAGSRASARYRPRQSHSVDSSVAQLRRYASLGYPNNELMQHTAGQKVRYFVTLFDYDPSTMSPNPNAANEELAFKEGSIIKVLGERGPDGFYRGELDGQLGYVPSNVVTEITDPNLIYNIQQQDKSRLLQQQQQPPFQQLQHPSQLVAGGQPQMMAVQPDPMQQPGVKRMTALYDYDPQENSPNADTESEIPFKVNDVIYVYGKMDTDGFYMGEVERTKQRGLVPSNFLREDPLPLNKPLDPNLKQQQQRPTANQFAANNVQQPNTGSGHMDPNFQQQQMNKYTINGISLQPRAGPPIRGMAPQQQQQQQLQAGQLQRMGQVDGMMQNTAQQSINRPTSLSLGNNPAANATNMGLQNNALAADAWRQQVMGPQQQQQQQLYNQMGQQQAMMPNQAFGAGSMQQMQPQYQQQQQQPLTGNNNQQANNGGAGGVLSNLLSSSKQIIGAAAASTPRMANNPATGQPQQQFGGPMMNQQQPGGMMSNVDDLHSNFGANFNRNQNLQLQQQPQQQVAFYQSNDPSQPTNNPTGGPYNMMATNQMQYQQQQQQPQQQQQQQQQARQQMPMQHQQHNQMGNMHRGPMGQVGEEQGGNILNTMKSIFKL